MASSDMASIDQWSFQPSNFADPWFSDALFRETQTLTKALTRSLTDGPSDFFSAVDDPFSPLWDSLVKPEPPLTPAVSNVSGGSDPEPAASKRQRSWMIPVSPTSGKVSKRKPRPSKRSQTTFITADPANFRQMVQQVTGARFSGSHLQAAAGILKPEAQMPSRSRLSAVVIPSGCLPTLDTSAFLLDNNHKSLHQQLQQVEAVSGPTTPSTSAGMAALSGPGVADGGGLDFVSFPSFPTLESWNAI